MKRLLPILLTGAALFAAPPQEPSAFGAGNLDNPNPYGLSDDEKHILQNKQAIEALRKQMLKNQQILMYSV